MSTSASRSTPARRGRPRVINDRSDVRAAAVALFAERGYRATGVREIADALGIGATSIYTHIKTKSELLHEILIDTLDAIIEMAEGVPRWFHPGREVSINQLAYLYGEYALRIVGVYNVTQPKKP